MYTTAMKVIANVDLCASDEDEAKGSSQISSTSVKCSKRKMKSGNSSKNKEKSNSGHLKITIEKSDSEEQRPRKITITIDEIDKHEAKTTKKPSENLSANISNCNGSDATSIFSQNKEIHMSQSSKKKSELLNKKVDENPIKLSDSDDGNEINVLTDKLNSKKKTLDNCVIDGDETIQNNNSNMATKLGHNQSIERKRKENVGFYSKGKKIEVNGAKYRKSTHSVIDAINSSDSSDSDDSCKQLKETLTRNPSWSKSVLSNKKDNESLIYISDSDHILQNEKNTLNKSIINVDEIKEKSDRNIDTKPRQNPIIERKCKKNVACNSKTEKIQTNIVKHRKSFSSVVDKIIPSDSSDSDDYCKQPVALGIKRKIKEGNPIVVNESSESSDCEMLNQNENIRSLPSTQLMPLNNILKPICLTDNESTTSTNETSNSGSKAVIDVDNSSSSLENNDVDVVENRSETMKIVHVGSDISVSSRFKALLEMCFSLDNSPFLQRRARLAFRQASHAFKCSERFTSMVSSSMRGLRQFPGAARDCLDDLIDCLMLNRPPVPRPHPASPTLTPVAPNSQTARAGPEGSTILRKVRRRGWSMRGLTFALRAALRKARALERTEMALADPLAHGRDSLYLKMHAARERVVRLWKMVRAARWAKSVRRNGRRHVRVEVRPGAEGEHGARLREAVAEAATAGLRAQVRGARLPRPLHYEAALHLVRAACTRLRLELDTQHQHQEAVVLCACLYAAVGTARRGREWRHLQLLTEDHRDNEEAFREWRAIVFRIGEVKPPPDMGGEGVPFESGHAPAPALLAALLPSHVPRKHPYRVIFSSDSEDSISETMSDTDDLSD